MAKKPLKSRLAAKRAAGNTKASRARRTTSVPRFNYGTECDICGATHRKGDIWSYVNSLGLMETRCKRHLHRPPTKDGPVPRPR